MLGFNDTTPSYKGGGQSQPAGGGGFLSGILGYLFGNKTPVYKGGGQPTATAAASMLGGLSPSAPAYRSTPPVTTVPPLTPPDAVESTVPPEGDPGLECPPDGNPPQVYVCIA